MKHIMRYLRDLWLRKDLLFYLVTSGLKADTRNTFLGYFWWVLDPLIMVLVFAFIRVVLIGRVEENLVAFLSIGLISFQFFAQTVTGSARSITGQAGVISQVYLPKAMFPLGMVFTQLVNYAFAFVTIAVILAASRIIPGKELAWLPLIVIVQTTFHMVIALTMAYLATFVRDLERILGHITRIMRFTAPIIFEAERIPDDFKWMLDYNPFAWLVMASRDVLMYGRVPPIERIVYLGAVSLFLVLLLLVFYSYNEHRIIKVL